MKNSSTILAIFIALLLVIGCRPTYEYPTHNQTVKAMVVLTAYHAVRAQTDSSPDIGAYGRVARNGIPTGRWLAANWLPAGTKVSIPNRGVYEVRDVKAGKTACVRWGKTLYPSLDILLFPGEKPCYALAEVEILPQSKEISITEIKGLQTSPSETATYSFTWPSWLKVWLIERQEGWICLKITWDIDWLVIKNKGGSTGWVKVK